MGAINQIITIKSNNPPIIPEINSFLPTKIRIFGASPVPDEFDPRFDAELRIYSYFIYQEVNLTRIQETLDLSVFWE